MALRCLFGPLHPAFAPAQLQPLLATGDVVPFRLGPPEPGVLASAWDMTWEAFQSRLPVDFQPDCVVLPLAYQALPTWLYAAPLPLVGLAGDWTLLFHQYRLQLPLLDAVLTDPPGVEVFARLGHTHVRPANLYGLDPHFPLVDPDTTTPRDIDVLFVGNCNAAVQGPRLPWLARLVALPERYRVQIATGVHGADYHALLRRARIVFNYSTRRECNMRVFEAAASGCLLFQEADCAEVDAYFTAGQEYVRYQAQDLEALLEYYLNHEEERQRLARAARLKVGAYTFPALWQRGLATLQEEWATVQARAAQRRQAAAPPSLTLRSWCQASATLADPTLLDDLQSTCATTPTADVLHQCGVARLLQPPLEPPSPPRQRFQEIHDDLLRSVHQAPTAVLPLLHLAALLHQGGATAGAAELATRVGRLLEDEDLDLTALQDGCLFPPGFDRFRVEWERAAWQHGGERNAELQAKRTLLRWQLHLLRGTLTQQLAPFYEAVLARPDLAVSRAALGCALGRAQQPAEAVAHLRAAVRANPLDREAARALFQAYHDSGETAAGAALAATRRRWHTRAPTLVAAEPWFQVPPREVESLTAEELAQRYGRLDTQRALCGYTPAADTQAVLTLLAAVQPQRVLEIGTALGHMTANLTEWTPATAVIYTLGIVAGMEQASIAEQQYEVPTREALGKFNDHFGKGHKVRTLIGDSLHIDFQTLAPLDFAFLDGAHDLAHVLRDTQQVYAALRPGGCLVWHDYDSATPWVEVKRAVQEAHLTEPLYHVVGTTVAFLFKQSSAPATAPATAPAVVPAALVWEGAQHGLHSLALVNRAFCVRLLERGHAVQLLTREFHPDLQVPTLPLPALLAAHLGKALPQPAEFHVRHFWPPDFTPPPAGHWIFFQPWEFGSLPRAWVDGILQGGVDEVWAHSRYVRDCYIRSGVPADRVQLVPLGVDLTQFHPAVPPLPLRTRKRCRLLFVGGTLWRKGSDILLTAYRRAFSRHDDVCLVIKEMGQDSFYQGQTAARQIAALQADAEAPEVEYLEQPLSSEQIAGLYTACDCLVHPYRGEGFGLPLAEALASGVPVVVTGAGAALDYCTPENAWLIPAEPRQLSECRLGEWETVAPPSWAEPRVEALVSLLRHVVTHPEEVRRKGQAGLETVRTRWTWDHAVAVVEQRLQALRRQPIRRLQQSALRALPAPSAPSGSKPRVSLTMIVRNEEDNLRDCLLSVRALVDEMIVVDTGSTDGTVALARELGARVFTFPWCDNFAAARNEALRHATGAWIFWLDADDRVDAPNQARLRQLFTTLPATEHVAFQMKCACLPDPAARSATVVDHIRLFRNHPQLRWQFRVHEQILPSIRALRGRVVETDVVITHTGYQDPALRGRKLERDRRLLHLELQDHPEHPFALFNLGSVLQEQGQIGEALALFRRSLERSQPGDSIERKLYANVVQCLRQLQQTAEAVQVCDQGLQRCPDDPELLWLYANLHEQRGAFPRAESALLRLLAGPSGGFFASVVEGLHTYRARTLLAEVQLRQGRAAEAEVNWQQVVQERPDWVEAWHGLARLCLQQGRLEALLPLTDQLEQLGLPLPAQALRVQRWLRLQQWDQAQALAEQLTRAYPQDTTGWELLSDVAMTQHDLPAQEAALRQVLLRKPTHRNAMQNLAVLVAQRLRSQDAVFEAQDQIQDWLREQLYENACHTPSAWQTHLSMLRELAKQCQHVTELGAGEGIATLALLAAQPKRLVSYDSQRHPALEKLEPLRGRTDWTFVQATLPTATIESTELLLLTLAGESMPYPALLQQLTQVRRWVVLHGDTAALAQAEPLLAAAGFTTRGADGNATRLVVWERHGAGG